ncbi:hypothetical protein SK128_017661 [Halocaridina rubra]|uniref:Cadherin domain-containing protein n=1 Tax=Halocaridina rubra TaxID=373956 RepID=A0AAN8XKQ9_HALRR
MYGRGGWDDPRHTDMAWVSVQIRDLNDNPPEFRRSQVHVTVKEDITPGTLLASLSAKDPDMAGHQGVKYLVNATWGALTIDNSGGVRLWRSLDREDAEGDTRIAEIISIDEGSPPQSSTATLTVTITDVNDCPPRLRPPTVLYVTEGRDVTNLGLILATDDDVWALGHGPPFKFSLSPSNPNFVKNFIDLQYDPFADSKRGGAYLWTKGPIDREEYPHLTVEVVVSDAGKLAASQPVTVVIGDINDNPMRPGAKTVYLWKMQGGGSDAALGRVYVEDPDDWDVRDKTFAWAGPSQHLFSLHTDTGAIFASSHLREGRYELQFSVSDSVWNQSNVRANVTVIVKYLQPEALANAVPITLSPTTPSALTAGWTPKGHNGGLGTLTKAAMDVIGSDAKSVEIVSVYGRDLNKSMYYIDLSSRSVQFDTSLRTHEELVRALKAPSASVWINAKESTGRYMDPVKLQGILALRLNKFSRNNMSNSKYPREFHSLKEAK